MAISCPTSRSGPLVIAALRPHTTKIFDCHLMIEPCDPYLEAFAKAGADYITVHVEATGISTVRCRRSARSARRRASRSIPRRRPKSIEYVLDRLDLVLLMTVNPGFGGQAFIPAIVEKVARVQAR